MEAADQSSQEKLDQLLRDGKITEDEYLRLSRALDKEPDWRDEPGVRTADHAKYPSSAGYFKNLPWQVRLIIAVLVVAGLIQFPIFIGKDPLRAFKVIIITVPVVYGLLHSKRWAFFVTLFFCFGSIVAIHRNPIGPMINIALGVVLLTAYQHFFPRKQNAGMMDKEC